MPRDDACGHAFGQA